MSARSKSGIIEEIKKDLFSDKDTKVSAALSKTREAADPSLVEPLLTFFATTSNPEWKAEAAEMLSTLKVSKVNKYFMDALANPSMKHLRREILAFMWNSNVQPVEDFVEITRIALAGNFEETFECLTLLESLDKIIPEEVLLECISLIGQYKPKVEENSRNILIGDFLALLETHRIKGEQD